MPGTTLTEENYIKAIYHLSEPGGKLVSTNAIAEILQINAASVTDMFKRLRDRKWVVYTKSKGVVLTDNGKAVAVQVVRRHRLWETFLVHKLGFSWEEVHEVAEQLEHIESPLLVEKLDLLLGSPKFDPHGDPIPDKYGRLPSQQAIQLTQGKRKIKYILTGVGSHNESFLKYLNKIKLSLGNAVVIEETEEFDGSMKILINNKNGIRISKDVAEQLLVTKK